MPTENHADLAEAIDRIKHLAVGAAGKIDIEPVNLPDGITGFPKTILLGHRRGQNPELLDILKYVEPWRDGPRRREGAAKVTTLASFNELVTRHKDEGSAIFAKTDYPGARLLAVIDYHGKDNAPRFGKHRVAYDFPLSPEFQAWIAQAGKPMPQDSFAEFLEANIADMCVAPEMEAGPLEELFKAKFAVPSDIIQLARGLAINVGAKIKNAFRTQTGETEFTFTEEHTNEKGEPVHVPSLFMLCIPLFVGGVAVCLAVRLRYRVKDGMILWIYDLYRWREKIRDRVVADLAIAGERTGLPTFEGEPEV